MENLRLTFKISICLILSCFLGLYISSGRVGSLAVSTVYSEQIESFSLLPGWPQEVGENDMVTTSALADLDDDGDLEIVTASYEGIVYIWHHDGEPLEFWPQRVPGDNPYIFNSSPAVADIDPDSQGLEIVVVSENHPGTNIQIYHRDGTLLKGWPQYIGTQTWNSSPAIADLDPDYPGLEIAVGTRTGGVFVFHSDGTRFLRLKDIGREISTPVIADVDPGYPGLEIVAVSAKDYETATVYAFHANGTVVSGWPQPMEGSSFGPSTPAVGNLDPNYPGLEIVVGSAMNPDQGKVYAFHANGTLVSGWPKDFSGMILSSPALADIDNDGESDVIIGVYGEADPYGIYVFNANGTLKAGWPQLPGGDVTSSPAIADFDPDYPGLEIVVGLSTEIWSGPDCNCGAVYVFHADGTFVDGSPIIVGDDINSSASIADLDKNGTLEIVMGVDEYRPYPYISGNVYVWTLPSSIYRLQDPWPTFHRNNARTGSNTAPVLNPIGNKFVFAGDTLSFQISAQDADNDFLMYSINGLPSGATFTAITEPTIVTFNWTPTVSQIGSYNVSFTVTDPSGATDSETIQISVSLARRGGGKQRFAP